MTSPDLPFKLMAGNDRQTALHNRIDAVERIKFLTGGIDLREKTPTYLKALDLELWHRWYKNEPPDKKIDEEFCQRAAEVIYEMDGQVIILNKEKFSAAINDHILRMEAVNDNEHVESDTEDAGSSGAQQGGMREDGSSGSD